MGGFSWWHILILVAVALLLFGGRNKISDLMGDFAKGIKNFREGMKDHKDEPKPEIANQKSEGQNPEKPT